MTEEQQKKLSAFNAHITKETDAKLKPFAKDSYPLLYFTVDEQKKLNQLTTDISTYVEQMEAKFITGAESLDKWDDYTKTLKKMNVDEMTTIYQQAYDRWKKVN